MQQFPAFETGCCDPQHAAPFEFSEFSYYTELALNAAAMRIQDVSLQYFGVDLLSDDGTIESLHLADTPLHRATFAISREIPNAHKFYSFMWRFMGLMRLFQSGCLDPWRMTEPDAPFDARVHPDVLDIARQMTLDPSGHFSQSVFKAAVTRKTECLS